MGARGATILSLFLLACAAPDTRVASVESEPALTSQARAAYLSEDADALRATLAGQPSALRRALELSALLEAECPLAELDQLLGQEASWVAHLERGDCRARAGSEREALEDFVNAVDLAIDPSEIDYVVLRVCRAADATALATIDRMCAGF